MTKKYKILAGMILLILGLLVYIEATKPDPINWYASYGNNDKIPYGLKVFHTVLKDQRGDNFQEVNAPPYEFIKENSDVKGTYVFINSGVYFDESETHRLIDWVAEGNTLFIASNGLSTALSDTLNLETEAYYDLDNFERTPLLNLSNPNFKKESPYRLDLQTSTSHFTEIDTLNTKVLGVFDLEKENVKGMEAPKVHFIKQKFGNGAIVMHLFPEAFTNYFMLHENNSEYTDVVQRYIPDNQIVYWDNHYKNSKTIYTSPLYMLFKNRYLKWAWYVLLIGVFLWVFFEGKRKQRAIPIVKPLPNQTVAYTHTIAGMYLEKSDHKSIATHQINHFLEYLRSVHNLDTSNLGLAFIERAAAKTGKPQDQTKRLIDVIQSIRSKTQITQEELERLNNFIEAYKSN